MSPHISWNDTNQTKDMVLHFSFNSLFFHVIPLFNALLCSLSLSTPLPIKSRVAAFAKAEPMRGKQRDRESSERLWLYYKL